MKRLITILLALGLISACTSSSKLLEKGKYDQAIEKSVEKLRKDPGNDKELRVLKEAYGQANMFDRDRIEFLKKEGREENWLEIYHLYDELKDRQTFVKTIPPVLHNQFAFVDYDDKLIEAKSEAAEVAYSRGIEYLDTGNRLNARLAYNEFEQVQRIYPGYRDVNRLQEEARFLGTNNVLFRIKNHSDVILPKQFDAELKKVSLKELNRGWVNYDTYADSLIDYDYYVVLNIEDIAVSPQSIERERWTESKEIQDGYEYVLDENGNVKKDSLGNDIKKPKYVTIHADVVQSFQYKEAFISGTLDFVDLVTNQLIKTEKVSVTGVFEHYSGVYSGNEDALSEETLQIVKRRPIPFPSDEALLMDSAYLLKDETKRIVHYNRRLLEQ